MTTVTFEGDLFNEHVANGLPWARINDAQAILFDTKELYYTWLQGQE